MLSPQYPNLIQNVGHVSSFFFEWGRNGRATCGLYAVIVLTKSIHARAISLCYTKEKYQNV